MATNPKTQGAREVFGEIDIDTVKDITGTVKTTSEHGIDSNSSSIEDLLKDILAQSRMTNLHLSRLSGETFTMDELEDE